MSNTSVKSESRSDWKLSPNTTLSVILEKHDHSGVFVDSTLSTKVKSANISRQNDRSVEISKQGRLPDSSVDLHDDKNKFKCPACPRSYTTSSALEYHSRSHAIEQHRRCVLSEPLKLIEHSSGKYYHCPICKNSFVERTQTDEKPFCCQHCSKSFTSSSGLVDHIRVHTGEKPFPCKLCTKTFSQSSCLKRHLGTHTGEKPFQCEMCEKRFFGLHQLTAHMRKPYHCNICGKSFACSNGLNEHTRIHTGEKPYKCSQCLKSFTEFSTFQTHKRVHTTEKHYKCSECSKSFKHSKNLKSHVRTHTGERPFKCSYCSKLFNESGNLVQHLRLHTGEKPYVCEICTKSFSHSSNFKVHSKKKKCQPPTGITTESIQEA